MNSGMQCAPEAFFWGLLCQLLAPKWRPRSPQGRPKGAPRDHKDAKRHPRDNSKTMTKSTCDPTWSSKAAREAPGVPPSKEIDPKISKKTKLFHRPQNVNKVAGVTPFHTLSKHYRSLAPATLLYKIPSARRLSEALWISIEQSGKPRPASPADMLQVLGTFV